MVEPTLLDEIIALTGMPSIVAAGMIKRALADGRVDVANARISDFERALPRIRARLAAYLTAGVAETRAAKIAAYLAEARLNERPVSGVSARRDRVRELLEGHAAASDPQPADEQDEDVTLVGRRWTADELAQIHALKSGTK